MATIQRYAAKGVWDPPTYAQAVKVTGAQTILYIAGQVAYDDKGGPAHRGDFKAQARAVFQALIGIEKTTPWVMSCYETKKQPFPHFYASKASPELLAMNDEVKRVVGREIDHRGRQVERRGEQQADEGQRPRKLPRWPRYRPAGQRRDNPDDEGVDRDVGAGPGLEA